MGTRDIPLTVSYTNGTTGNLGVSSPMQKAMMIGRSASQLAEVLAHELHEVGRQRASHRGSRKEGYSRAHGSGSFPLCGSTLTTGT